MRASSIRSLFLVSSESKHIGRLYHDVIFFPSHLYYLKNSLKNCNSVLDLGCGNNSLLRYLPYGLESIGVECFKDSLIDSKKKSIFDEYILANINDIEFKEKSVDAIILIEVIEHLNKVEGMELLLKLENVARKKIIISTPNGFVPQEREDNPYQTHKSGWSIDDLRTLGYKDFRGVGGIRIFKFFNKSQFLFILFQSILQKIAYFNPEIASGLLCTKILEE